MYCLKITFSILHKIRKYALLRERENFVYIEKRDVDSFQKNNALEAMLVIHLT